MLVNSNLDEDGDIPIDPIPVGQTTTYRRKTMAETFLPRDDAGLVLWYNNFQLKFATYALTVGFVAADVTAVQADYTMLNYIVNLATVFKEEAKERNSYKDTFRDGPLGVTAPATPTIPTVTVPGTIPAPGIVPRLRAIIQRIKAHPNYTNAMGVDLGIVAPVSTPTGTPKPTATAEAQPGSQILIKWVKGAFDGVQIESQRASETTWTLIGTDTSSPYLDSRAPLAAGQPEIRRYRLRYFKGDVPTGDYSDILTITTTPYLHPLTPSLGEHFSFERLQT